MRTTVTTPCSASLLGRRSASLLGRPHAPRGRILLLLLVTLALTFGAAAALLREIPQTKPNEVVPLADGVYFRHGDLEHNGHCNNGIILFDEFVLVVDGNFPSGAEACLADVRKITDKPVRFVFNTHHHGDHAYGNPVWVKNGVVPVAHEGVASEMARVEPGRWKEAMTTREDVKATGRDVPTPPVLTFPDRMVLDDGKMRVELLYFGTAHTRGDGFAYLPRQKILFTGDAVVNGPYNFMGDGNTESWLQVVSALKELDVEVVAPGHGPVGEKSVLDDQQSYIASLREQVAQGLKEGKSLTELTSSVKAPAKVERYVGSMFAQQVAKVRSEMLGLEMPLELERLGLRPGPSMKGVDWTPPKKIIYAGDPAGLADLKVVAPDVNIVMPGSQSDLLREAADADAVIGRISKEIVQAGIKLRWVHSLSAGVEQYLGTGDDKAPGIDALRSSSIVLTNGKRCYGPNISDQVFAYLLNFTRQMKSSVEGRLKSAPGGVGGGNGGPKEPSRWQRIDPSEKHEVELRGKTLLILGLGGIGSEVAQRAKAFGMRVIGVDPKVATPPRGVDELRRPEDLMKELPRADVVVVACPLTKKTRGSIGPSQFAVMKNGTYFINVARGRIVDFDALAAAAKSGKLAGVGLDVTDPEPLPDGSPLWDLENVIITPHNAGQSDGSRRRVQLLVRENIRRFVVGEPLLNVVDKEEGY